MSKAAPLTVVVARGDWGTVECVVLNSGKVPAQEFLAELEGIREKSTTARAKFMVLFQQMADYGRVATKRFDKEMGKLWAFKMQVRNFQIRFPCFSDLDKWVLTHGFLKPGAQKGRGAWPRTEIERAERFMAEYEARARTRHN